jgi:hypothetical protein
MRESLLEKIMQISEEKHDIKEASKLGKTACRLLQTESLAVYARNDKSKPADRISLTRKKQQ